MTKIAAYAGVFAVVISLVAVGYRAPDSSASFASVAQVSSPVASTVLDDPSVDQIVATSIAADLAETANLPVATNVANLSVSLAAKSELAQVDETSISKPQIVQPTANNREIITHTVQDGETTDSIAARFGISKDTLKWANNLTSDALEPGRELAILPVDGIRYTLKDNETIDDVAQKYQADKSRIVAFNDLELSGAASGQQIIIPGGVLPTTERPGYSAPSTGSGYRGSASSVSSAFAMASSGNRYAFGNCTWYAYERRAQLGRPVGSFWGNAATWHIYAAAAGFRVDGTPAPGAIMQNGGGYGHVAIVESVNPGVSITISEMNGYRFGGGFNRVATGEVSWGQAVGGNYRYIH